MNKKSEGLSLSVVVIAVVALVVLIILIVIFASRLSTYNKGVSECPVNTIARDSNQIGPGGFCEGGKLPKQVISDKKTGETIYCCEIDPCAQCTEDEECDRRTDPPSCVNIMTDDQNCGRIGRVCQAGTTCIDGDCE